MKRLSARDFRVPAALVALGAVPLLGGIARLSALSHPETVGPETARFAEAPVPIILHVITATLYCLLGAFQFSSGLRRRWPRAHRRAGKLLATLGTVAAITGLWMTAVYPIPVGMQGPLLFCIRLLVGTAMLGCILIGTLSILRRDVARHGGFMIRAYALGQGAGTQALVLGPWMLITGESAGLTRDLLMTLAWVINLVVAELVIHSRGRRRSAITAGQPPLHSAG